MKEVIAIDFDGVLCENEWPNIGKPNASIIELVKQLKQQYIIILWTCREGKDLNEAIEWCKQYNLQFDYINDNAKERIEQYHHNSRKISADYYLDDKNIQSISIINNKIIINAYNKHIKSII